MKYNYLGVHYSLPRDGQEGDIVGIKVGRPTDKDYVRNYVRINGDWLDAKMYLNMDEQKTVELPTYTEKQILHSLVDYIDLDLVDDIYDLKVIVKFLSWMLGYPVDEVREKLSKEKEDE